MKDYHLTFAFFFVISDDTVTGGVGKLRMKPDDFNLIKVIGRGAYGEVQLVSDMRYSVYI